MLLLFSYKIENRDFYKRKNSTDRTPSQGETSDKIVNPYLKTETPTIRDVGNKWKTYYKTFFYRVVRLASNTNTSRPKHSPFRKPQGLMQGSNMTLKVKISC